MKLRIRDTRHGKSYDVNTQEFPTVDALRRHISTLTGIPVDLQVLKRDVSYNGNRPNNNSPQTSRKIVETDGSLKFAQLSHVGFEDRETIYVEEKPFSPVGEMCGKFSFNDPQSEKSGGPLVDVKNHSTEQKGQLQRCVGIAKVNSGGAADPIIDSPANENIVAEFYRHEIPSDNSCLFGCLNYMVCNNAWTIAKLRHLVADYIRRDPSYSEVMLEKPREEYMRWICQPDSWGGYLELTIFSRSLNVNIAVYDIQTKRVDLYGEEFPRIVYLLYDGVHYDCLAARTADGRTVKVFHPWDEVSRIKVETLVDELHRARRYVSKDCVIECGVCKVALEGFAQAQQHSTRTGHTEFRQIK